MNGTEKVKLLRFHEGMKLDESYYAEPDPYKSAPSMNLDLPALARYAKKTGRQIVDMTEEEIDRFAI